MSHDETWKMNIGLCSVEVIGDLCQKPLQGAGEGLGWSRPDCIKERQRIGAKRTGEGGEVEEQGERRVGERRVEKGDRGSRVLPPQKDRVSTAI